MDILLKGFILELNFGNAGYLNNRQTGLLALI